MTETEQQTKYRPILFSGPMVRAILEGRKTQARRVVNPPFRQLWGCGVKRNEDNYSIHVDIKEPDGNWKWLYSPYGKPGDRLWVRETWRVSQLDDYQLQINWKADDSVHVIDPDSVQFEKLDDWTFRPSIHMPRWASRITLEVTAIRVERLQEIGEDDAVAEGFTLDGCGGEGPVNTLHRTWDHLNAKRGFSWDSNPWVWVVEFRIVK